MASFVLSFFPLDVLDEIWDLIESVSEGFLTYSFKSLQVLAHHVTIHDHYLSLNHLPFNSKSLLFNISYSTLPNKSRLTFSIASV